MTTPEVEGDVRPLSRPSGTLSPIGGEGWGGCLGFGKGGLLTRSDAQGMDGKTAG